MDKYSELRNLLKKIGHDVTWEWALGESIWRVTPFDESDYPFTKYEEDFVKVCSPHLVQDLLEDRDALLESVLVMRDVIEEQRDEIKSLKIKNERLDSDNIVMRMKLWYIRQEVTR